MPPALHAKEHGAAFLKDLVDAAHVAARDAPGVSNLGEKEPPHVVEGRQRADDSLDGDCILPLDAPLSIRALLGIAGALVVCQNPAHDPGCDGIEVRPALPRGLAAFTQSKVGLVHQRGCLKRVAAALAAQATPCNPVRLL